MRHLFIALGVVYALMLVAECADLLRRRKKIAKKIAWRMLRLPTAGIALVPLLMPIVQDRTPDGLAQLDLPQAAAIAPEPDFTLPDALAMMSPPNHEPGIHWYIHHYAKIYEVDPLLVLAMIETESNFDPKAVSHRGAMGLMQINRVTAQHLGLKNPFDIRQNIEGGIRYLRELLERYGWSLHLALASYNAGPTAVQRFKGVPPYPETREYVSKVLKRYRRLKRTEKVFRAVTPPPSELTTAEQMLASSQELPQSQGKSATAF